MRHGEEQRVKVIARDVEDAQRIADALVSHRLWSDEEDPDGPDCEHYAYSFFDDGEKYCVDCYQPLDEEDE